MIGAAFSHGPGSGTGGLRIGACRRIAGGLRKDQLAADDVTHVNGDVAHVGVKRQIRSLTAG